LALVVISLAVMWYDPAHACSCHLLLQTLAASVSLAVGMSLVGDVAALVTARCSDMQDAEAFLPSSNLMESDFSTMNKH